MKYLIYKNNELQVVETDKETIGYKDLQEAVGGYIEAVRLDPYGDSKGVDIYINEEGKLMGLEPSLKWANGKDVLCGNVVFCSYDDEGESVGLNQEQIELVEKYVAENRLSEIEWKNIKEYLANIY